MIELLKGHEDELTDLMDELYFNYETLEDEGSSLDSDRVAFDIIHEEIDEIREKITLKLKELGVNQVTIDDIFRNACCYVDMDDYWNRMFAGELPDNDIIDFFKYDSVRERHKDDLINKLNEGAQN